jgi:hypothetical protein
MSICVNTHVLKKTYDIRTQTCKCDLPINASPAPYLFVYQGIWKFKQSIVFTSILPWDLVICLRKFINIGIFA